MELEPSDYTLQGNMAAALYYSGHPIEAADAYKHAIALAEREIAVNPGDASRGAFGSGKLSFDVGKEERPQSTSRGAHCACPLTIRTLYFRLRWFIARLMKPIVQLLF